MIKFNEASWCEYPVYNIPHLFSSSINSFGGSSHKSTVVVKEATQAINLSFKEENAIEQLQILS